MFEEYAETDTLSRTCVGWSDRLPLGCFVCLIRWMPGGAVASTQKPPTHILRASADSVSHGEVCMRR